jgi:hypothetical protein
MKVRDKFIVWEHNAVSKNGTSYKLCLNYEKDWIPRIWIVEPNLAKENIPHVFKAVSNQLCLYHARDFTWTKNEDIIKTLVFWALIWIEYYEFYKILGKWGGPEATHDMPKQLNDTSEVNKKNSKINKKMPMYLKNYPIRY